MLTDQQSLILCGIMGMGIFVTGILDILGNSVILAIFTLIFSAIIINLFFWKHPKEDNDQENID